MGIAKARGINIAPLALRSFLLWKDICSLSLHSETLMRRLDKHNTNQVAPAKVINRQDHSGGVHDGFPTEISQVNALTTR